MRYFITYGDKAYTRSAQRLTDEALHTQLFDKTHIFSPEELPDSIRKHPLMQYRRGGGYWFWKPYVILTALQEMNDGDILVYADAGCSIRPSEEWNTFFNILKKKSVLAFKLGFRNKFYTKRSALNYITREEKYWSEYQQIAGGILLIRKTAESMQCISTWLQLMDTHPELVTDVSEDERKDEAPYFIEHRHDQCILSTSLFRYRHIVALRWENFEYLNPYEPQAFIASRISDANPQNHRPKISRFKYLKRKYIGRPLFSMRQQYWEWKSRHHKA